jgi:Glucodextranase, domain B/Bacterial Ig domain
MARYSRLESVEEKRNFRNAVLFIILSVAAVIILIVVGIPAVGKIATYVSGLKNGNKVAVVVDKTPPAPPNFNTYPDFTNQSSIGISGTAEPNSTVKLNFNGSTQSATVDNFGNFSFKNLQLTAGNNVFSATAVDSSGNISQKTPDNTIVYDSKPPTLTIDSPTDGSSFFGSAQMQATIQGTTDSGVSITINGRIVSVDDNGKFEYTTTLSSGANQFKVVATDQAGNTTEKDITLNFSQ